jgi:hypothetical protein
MRAARAAETLGGFRYEESSRKHRVAKAAKAFDPQLDDEVIQPIGPCTHSIQTTVGNEESLPQVGLIAAGTNAKGRRKTPPLHRQRAPPRAQLR